jgi:hypothetical protein
MGRLKLITAVALSAVLVAGALPVASSLGQGGTLTLGKVKKNKRNGTAKVKANLPAAGKVVCKGKKVKKKSKSLAGAGSTRVKIVAKRKPDRKLEATGKLRVKFRCTFTPSNPGQYGPFTSSKKKRTKLIDKT